MSKHHYKRHNNISSITSNEKYFSENGILNNFENYFTIFNKTQLNYCWIFISQNFNKYLTFNGKCNLQIFFGSIKINGIQFSAPFSQKIYSPLSHSKITIEIGKNLKNESKSINECVKELGLLSESEKNVLNSLNDDNKWIVVRAETVECIVSEDLSQFKDFRRLFEVNIKFPYAKKLKFSFIEEENPCYIMTKEISDTLDEIINTLSIKTNVSVAVVGPKDSGKSTLMRTIINRFFAENCTEVFVIDGDPGQCEFTPNGCLSLTKISAPLLGPPFTHQFSNNINIIKQFFLGLLSPANNPNLYCRTFEMLYQTYLTTSNQCCIKPAPLIINTMGWPEGMGFFLLAFKLLMVNPTFILQLKKGRHEKEFVDINMAALDALNLDDSFLQNLPRTLTSTINILKSPVLTSQRHDLHLKPIQHRDLTMLAYLFTQTINHPLCFPIDSLPADYKYNPVTRLRCRLPSFLSYTIDGRRNTGNTSLPIVNLKLVHSGIDLETQSTEIDQCFALQWVAICRPYDKPTFKSVLARYTCTSVKEMEPMYCIGMGLVSHVRPENNQIDLLTGVDYSLLSGSQLVKGKVFCPDCLFLSQRELLSKNNVPALPFLSPMITVGIGKTSFTTRKSLPKIRRHNY